MVNHNLEYIIKSEYVNTCQQVLTCYTLSIMNPETRNTIIKLAKEQSFFRARDICNLGIASRYLSELVSEGTLMRSGRGVYFLSDNDLTEHHNLVEIAYRVPHAVIALVSALRFHNLTTQNPREIWIAINRGQRKPSIGYPPLQVFYYSEESFYEGIEEHKIEGEVVKVYSVEKTLADCFKFRSKIGLDVAIEALSDARKSKKLNYDKLYQFAEQNRIFNILRPYVEAIPQ